MAVDTCWSPFSFVRHTFFLSLCVRAPVDANSFVWQLGPRTLRTGTRECTTSTISTASTHSHSSYAFVSDPSSFATSLESGPSSDAEEVYSLRLIFHSPTMVCILSDGSSTPNSTHSRSISPGRTQPSMTSSSRFLDSSLPSPTHLCYVSHGEKLGTAKTFPSVRLRCDDMGGFM